MKNLIKQIKYAQKIILSTHRTPDGDGLGSEVGLFHALRQLGKEVRLVHVDEPAYKYNFLMKKVNVEIYTSDLNVDCDLALVFDTNDARMIPGLWDRLSESNCKFAFIDHHPILAEAPDIGELSYIDTNAASTGEIVFEIIRSLDVEVDENIAEAIYTSICFDTQLFRYVKSSAKSHAIAAKLIPYIEYPENIHDSLFGNIPIEKFRFVSHCTNKIEFFFVNQLAYLEITDADLVQFNMSNEDTRDLTDQILAIDSVEVALVIAPTGKGKKLSFRSKKPIYVLNIAKAWGGGGHPFASGAFVKNTHPNFSKLKELLIEEIGELL